MPVVEEECWTFSRTSTCSLPHSHSYPLLVPAVGEEAAFHVPTINNHFSSKRFLLLWLADIFMIEGKSDMTACIQDVC